MGQKRAYHDAFDGDARSPVGYEHRRRPQELTPPSSPSSPAPLHPANALFTSPDLQQPWTFRSVAITPKRGLFAGFHYEEDFGAQVCREYSRNCYRAELRRLKYGDEIARTYHSGFTPEKVREAWRAEQDAKLEALYCQSDSDAEEEKPGREVASLGDSKGQENVLARQSGQLPSLDAATGETNGQLHKLPDGFRSAAESISAAWQAEVGHHKEGQPLSEIMMPLAGERNRKPADDRSCPESQPSTMGKRTSEASTTFLSSNHLTVQAVPTFDAPEVKQLKHAGSWNMRPADGGWAQDRAACV